jgi:membrane-bound lytic murein transglycosylase B
MLSLAGLIQPDSAIAPSVQGPPASAPPPAPAPGLDQAAFDAWLQDFQARAVAAGWPADILTRELTGLTPNPRVLALDGAQPEFSKPVGDYVRAAISDARVATAQHKRSAATWLPPIEARFGVPGEILVAIWAQESAFGTIQGDLDVIRSLATLAAAGRRRTWAEAQLLAALTMIKTGEVSRAQLRGGWAGAMGQSQMIPEAFLASAVDGDGDGRRDIWNSSADALASAANLLVKGGWKAGQGWASEVVLPPDFDYGLAEGPRQSPAAWQALGVQRADGRAWSAADQAATAQLIVPSGAAGPVFLALPNHFAIRTYNNSTAYALAVGLLADRIAGAPPLLAAWPPEQALSTQERIAAQKALAQLGFDPGEPDGVVGMNTRSALRAWQKSKGLPADAYLTPQLGAQLQAEAAAVAATQN